MDEIRCERSRFLGLVCKRSTYFMLTSFDLCGKNIKKCFVTFVCIIKTLICYCLMVSRKFIQTPNYLG